MAEAKEDFSEKQHLECPVCFQPYSISAHKPKILPCGHSFCLECLEKIKGSMNSITCPKDMNEFSIPSFSVDKLPNNFTVLEILTNLCDDCGGQPKQQVCLEEHCSMSLCDGCRENHCQSFHSNLRAALTDIKQQASLNDDDSDIVQLEDDAEAAIAEVTKLCDELKHSLIKEIKTLKENSMESYFKWKVAIGTAATECRVNGQKLLSQIGKIYKTDKRDKVLIDARRQITEMKTKLSKNKDSKPALVEFKIESLKNEFDAFLLELYLKINPLTEIRKGDSLMVQDQASGGQCGSSTQQTQATTKPDYTRATLHATYGRQGIGEGMFCDPRGISISPVTNQVAVVDKRNDRIHLLTDSLRPVSVFDKESKDNNRFRFPWDVTINDKGLIFTTEEYNHCVKATDSHGVFLYMFGTKGAGQDQFQTPLGIASTHEHLYICDSENHRVKVTLHAGTYVREFGIGKNPRLIAVSEAQDKGVISDTDGNIHVFTLTGKFLRVIKSYKAPLNIEARGLAFDKHGNLIVADWKGKLLVVLGEEDQLIATIGSGQLGEPWGVVITLSGDIVVCDEQNHCVKLFKVPHCNRT